MLGAAYLIFSYILGYQILKRFFPIFYNISILKSLTGSNVQLNKSMILVPCSFLIGTIFTTWITYIGAYVFKSTTNPLLYGNIISFFTILIAIFFLIKDKYKIVKNISKKNILSSILGIFNLSMSEKIFLSIVSIVSIFLMVDTFYIKGNQLYISQAVWSDFGPHIAVIRSFSLGQNFPTTYPHFAEYLSSNDMRYHFLFQFLSANLEFLGMRLDIAFNLPSILSMISFFMLLYSFSIILTGKRAIGFLTSGLFFFRSSYAFFTFISELGNKPIVKTILENDLNIGKTQNENWGLWAQKVYVNQRHLLFSVAILLMVLIYLYPYFYKMVSDIYKNLNSRKSFRLNTIFNELVLKKDAWIVGNIKSSIIIGIVLGLAGFWNGAVVIVTLCIIGVLAIFSKNKFDYLIIAGITVFLVLIESWFFISSGSAVSPKINIGFLADNKDFLGILAYYIEMLGAFVFIIISSIFLVPVSFNILSIAFAVPIILATTVQLTPDINVNHKFIIISVILLNIIVSYVIYIFYNMKKFYLKIVAVVLVGFLTITGFVDIISLYNLNKQEKAIVITTNDPLFLWAIKNTNTTDIFLTQMAVTHPILSAGRKVFFGWPYYAWSAGYDTISRGEIVKQIYGAKDRQVLENLLKKNHINYIVIEPENRSSTEYTLNEELIKSSLKLVYHDIQKDVSVYKAYLEND